MFQLRLLHTRHHAYKASTSFTVQQYEMHPRLTVGLIQSLAPSRQAGVHMHCAACMHTDMSRT